MIIRMLKNDLKRNRIITATLVLGTVYDTPHGVANAMGVKEVKKYRKAACDAVRKLSKDVGIPTDLKAIVKERDIAFLAESAVKDKDACAPGNPKEATLENVISLYKSLL